MYIYRKSTKVLLALLLGEHREEHAEDEHPAGWHSEPPDPGGEEGELRQLGHGGVRPPAGLGVGHQGEGEGEEGERHTSQLSHCSLGVQQLVGVPHQQYVQLQYQLGGVLYKRLDQGEVGQVTIMSEQ